VGSFQAINPTLAEPLPQHYPVSSQADAMAALEAASNAADILWTTPGAKIADFLEQYANLIEEHRDSLVDLAHLETGLAKEPRLNSNELPRTINQLRQAAEAARTASWQRPIIDETLNIHSHFAPLGGAVVVLGPNNFPFAFNSIAGGDFAAAIAAGNPVIAKANTGHPGTTKRFAELVLQAVQATGLPKATVQLLYRTPSEVGLELVAHPLVGATGFTGSKNAGLKLKEAADRVGKPIYLEMSSINPVYVLPGALQEKSEAIAQDFFTSCTLGAGQFCTSPGLVVLLGSQATEDFIASAVQQFQDAQAGVLLGESGLTGLEQAVTILVQHGATLLTGGKALSKPGFRFENTLLRVTGEQFLANPEQLQTEAFGPVALFVIAKDTDELIAITQHLEGNLTGSIYSHSQGHDDALYNRLEPVLRRKVGRLLNDKMPTGVAVSPAMNHGGPFPATGHPGFTAVGMPVSIQRFAVLYCYDNVRLGRLPSVLREAGK
jgi:2,5-dioxopentanoate dehydrogenase